jgi:hypothetical protein
MAWREDSELRPGASNVNDEYAGDVTREHAARIADGILSQVARYGDAREEPKPYTLGRSTRRNRHLDGYGNPRS